MEGVAGEVGLSAWVFELKPIVLLFLKISCVLLILNLFIKFIHCLIGGQMNHTQCKKFDFNQRQTQSVTATKTAFTLLLSFLKQLQISHKRSLKHKHVVRRSKTVSHCELLNWFCLFHIPNNLVCFMNVLDRKSKN